MSYVLMCILSQLLNNLMRSNIPDSVFVCFHFPKSYTEIQLTKFYILNAYNVILLYIYIHNDMAFSVKLIITPKLHKIIRVCMNV